MKFRVHADLYALKKYVWKELHFFHMCMNMEFFEHRNALKIETSNTEVDLLNKGFESCNLRRKEGWLILFLADEKLSSFNDDLKMPRGAKAFFLTKGRNLSIFLQADKSHRSSFKTQCVKLYGIEVANHVDWKIFRTPVWFEANAKYLFLKLYSN